MSWKKITSAIAAVFVVCGCSIPQTADQQAMVSETDGWPRTVEYDDKKVTIPAKPQRIAALSNDMAETVLALTGSQQLIAVDITAVESGYANHSDIAQQVPHIIPGDGSPDPEQVIALDPDLVLISHRMPGERDAAEVLESFGVPLIYVERPWSSLEDIRNYTTTIGEAIGAEQQAKNLINEIDRGIEEVVDSLPEEGESDPNVLILQARGPQIVFLGSDHIVSDLVRTAGGNLSVERFGITNTTPADPETLIAMAPDVILLIDVNDGQKTTYEDYLAHPGLKNLSAIRDGRVYRVDGADVATSSGRHIVDGIKAIAASIHNGK